MSCVDPKCLVHALRQPGRCSENPNLERLDEATIIWSPPASMQDEVADLLGPDAVLEVLGQSLGTHRIGSWDEAQRIATAYDAADALMGNFVDGCLRSGMVEAVCNNCGRPWLTRPKLESRTQRVGRSAVLRDDRWLTDPLCPECEGKPEGYVPSDAPRWVEFWRLQVLEVLRQRARPRLELVPRSVWVGDIPLQRFESLPRLGGEITRWHIGGLGAVPHERSWPRATFAPSCLLSAWMPVGQPVCAQMWPTVPEKPRSFYLLGFLPVPG